jgi:hypothetical protein
MTSTAFGMGYGTPDPAAVGQVAEKYGISLAKARANLAVQDRAGDIVGRLQDVLGDDYAGVWFDPAGGRFTAGAVDARAASAAAAAFQAAGVGEGARTERVAATWSQLEAAQREWNARLSTTMRANGGSTRIDPTRNAVVVEVPDNVPAASRSALRADAVGASVVVETVPAEEAAVRPNACAVPYCDQPIRGGVRINSTPESNGSYYYCTAGFAATNPQGLKYLITAGHCVLGTVSKYYNPWWTLDSAGNTITLYGRANEAVGPNVGDVAVIGVRETQTLAPWVSVWGYTNEHPIVGVGGTSYLGQTHCGVGVSSGMRCGQITMVHGSIYVDYAAQGGGLTAVSPTDAVSVCSIPGDSGGPWTVSNWGTGIDFAGSTSCPTSGSSYFTPLSTAESVLGVNTLLAP